MSLTELPMAGSSAPSETPEVAEGKRRFEVQGMDCGACAKTVEKAVLALDGVDGAAVSFGAGTLSVDGDVAEENVAAAVRRAGYRLKTADPRLSGRPFWRRDARALSTSGSAVVLLIAVVSTLSSAPRPVEEALYLLSMAVGGWPIAVAAAGALRRRSLDMNVLMALAAVGAVGIGAYAEGAWVLVLFAVGTTLETFALDRSRRSVDALLDLAPAQARVSSTVAASSGRRRRGRHRRRRSSSARASGSPLDGTSSRVRPASTSRRSPASRSPLIWAPTTSLRRLDERPRGAGRAQHQERPPDSTLSRVAALVEEAQGSRAPAERFVDRFARVYTPLVFVGGARLLVVPPLAFGGDVDTWIYRALALLIVACPARWSSRCP